jgi:2,3,4,5-tetrahydropyridine-2,6-dicarboxylate N-succinyltransferase
MADQTATAVHPLEAQIETAFERRSEISPGNVDPALVQALDAVLQDLNAGRLRVAEKQGDTWITHQWIKKAVLLYFRTHDNQVMPTGAGDAWFDKVPLRFAGYTDTQFREGGFRVVPPATVRSGAFIGRNVVLMPSYVNIGAWVGSGTMVDTWATVGSCAQIGRNVHLAGGVGIGGVLEPPGARPVIIEDDAFIGSRRGAGARGGADRVGADHRCDRIRARDLPGTRSRPLGRVAGHTPQAVPSGRVPHRVRLDRGRAVGVDRHQDLAQRRPPRARRRSRVMASVSEPAGGDWSTRVRRCHRRPMLCE